MLSDPNAQRAPADWYLIASRGDLVLRLAQDLQIGEDGIGGIVLSPAAVDALLRISIRDSELTLQALAMDWTFCDHEGSTRQYRTFPAGATVKLNFPTCSVVITPHFLAGERADPDSELDLRPITPPAVALTRLSEPVTLVDQPAATWQALPPIGVATTEEVAALLEADSADDYEVLLSARQDVPDETPQEIPLLSLDAAVERPIRAPAPMMPVQDRSTETTTQTRRSISAAARVETPRRDTALRQARGRHRALAASLMALALLAPMALLLEAPERLGVNFPRSSYLPPGEAAEPVWPEDPPPAPLPARQAVPVIEPSVTVSGTGIGTTPEAAAGSTAQPRAFDEPLPLAEPEPGEQTAAAQTASGLPTDGAAVPPPETTTQPTPAQTAAMAPPSLSDDEAARVATLLREAQALYDADAIVMPIHRNAVSRLTEVLKLDPTNEMGLKLMYESALRLTEEAEAAHAAGNEYLARNLLEDVLGFHPEFEMARKLQEDWNRETDGNG